MRLTWLVVLSAASISQVSHIVSAGAAERSERAVCVEAAGQAQALRDAHKLISARESLRVCGRTVCPSAVVKDCIAWLREADADIPAVVLVANDSAGHLVSDVKVSIDGVVVANELDGIPIEVDPGLHNVVLEGADGARSERRILAESGDKHISIHATLRQAEPTIRGPSAPGGTPPEASHVPAETVAIDRTPPASAASGQRTAGLVTGAVGLMGLGVGTVFGSMAIADRLKTPEDVVHGKPAADVATVSFALGAVATATGLVLLLTAPTGARRPAAVWLTPTPAGVQIGGQF